MQYDHLNSEGERDTAKQQLIFAVVNKSFLRSAKLKIFRSVVERSNNIVLFYERRVYVTFL